MVGDPSHLTPKQAIIAEAFREAGIGFDLFKGMRAVLPIGPKNDAEILVSARLN